MKKKIKETTQLASGIKHNRKRNTGIIYELLARQMTREVLDEDRMAAATTFSLIRRHFDPKTAIGYERRLFETIRSCRGLSESSAREVLKRVVSEARQMNSRYLDLQKSALIKDLHQRFGQKFFGSYKLNDYRLLGSIQIFLDGVRGKRTLSEDVDRLRIEDGIVHYMTTTEPYSPAPTWSRDEKVDQLVCGIATKKFNEKYGKELSEQQRRVLSAYSLSLMTEDMGKIQKRLAEDRGQLLSVLKKAATSADVIKDVVMKQRLDEVMSQLERMDTEAVTEGKVEDVMLYWRLAAEIESDE